MTWEKGRQLKSIDGTVYTYNAKGIRTSKTVDGVLHTYFIEGTQIKHEAWGDDQLSPLYDNEDSVCGIFYNTVPYYFIKNLQGDVIAIADENGQVVARYSYDAWGACEIISDTSDCSIATINPFRYRSYYYDTDTGLYYLQSRYYNPTVGRFLNGDIPEICAIALNCLVLNLFCYCQNNPINNEDYWGYFGFKDIWSVFKDAFDFISDIGELLVKKFPIDTRDSRIKKLSKLQGKSQRQIKRELNNIVESTKKTSKFLKKFGKILSFLTIVFAVFSCYRQTKEPSFEIHALIVDIFVDTMSEILSVIVGELCKFIPYVGIFLGFAASFTIGIVINNYFGSKRKRQLTEIYMSKTQNNTNWIQWVSDMFTSLISLV